MRVFLRLFLRPQVFYHGGYSWECLVPISNQQRPFPHPFSDPASKTHTCFQTGTDRNKRKEKGFLEAIWNSHVILLSYSFGIDGQIRS